MKDGSTERQRESRPGYADLEEWVRGKVQQFIQEILEEEVTEVLGRQRHERRQRVDVPAGYRNGYGKKRRLAMQGGTIEVRRPRVRDVEKRFESRILPLFKRRTEQMGQMLAELYLHGLSQGDFELALRGLLGDGAPLSACSIQRLKAKWEVEYEAWRKEDLSKLEVVYLWADGLYVKAGIGKDKAALLVIMVGLRDGTKRVVAVESGYRESKASWVGVLRDLQRRGLSAPRLTIADGHLGIWAALSEIWPGSQEQRCWNHKIVNVLDRLPRRIQPEAKELLSMMPYAQTLAACERLRKQFRMQFASSYPKAVEILETDWERMVTFYRFPKDHWIHIRTTNVVESPFSSVRLRTNAARRYRNVANATALIWKTLMVAQCRFRRLNAPHLLNEVYEGFEFLDGIRICAEQKREAA